MLRSLLRAAAAAGSATVARNSQSPHHHDRPSLITAAIAVAATNGISCRHYSSKPSKSSMAKGKVKKTKGDTKSDDFSTEKTVDTDPELDNAQLRVRLLEDDEKNKSLDVGPNGRPLFVSNTSFSQLTRKDTCSYIISQPIILLSSFLPSTAPFYPLKTLTNTSRPNLAKGLIMSRSSRTLYVGNLPGDVREKEVDDLFYKYGPIAHIDLKIPPRPPGYAFVEFEEARDAEDAIRGRDGYDFDGHRLRVELAHGGRGYSSSIDRHSSQSGGGRRGGVSRRSDYRVLITGLPSNASWQDLKDHMRKAGDVCFSQVFHNRHGRGTHGIVDYTNSEDMKYAIRKLDDSEFKNAFGRKVIHVEEYRGSSRSGSRSPSYSRARSYSRSRSRSPSHSRSRSRDRSYSRSISPRSPKVDKSRDSRTKHRSKSVSSRSPSRSRSPLSRSPSRSRSPVLSHQKHLSRSPKEQSKQETEQE